MSNTQNYEMWGETVGLQYEDVERQDWYPFHNQWRGRPLDQRAFIRNNTAGWYPYNKTQRIIKRVPEAQWKYTWYYPCSTIFPTNPQFVADRTIILER
jgi:hypothetical protein